MFKLPYVFALALFLLATRNAHAFIDSPYITPQHPTAGEEVFANIRAGICDGIGSIPGYPQVTRSGSDVRIIVWSDSFTDPILCNFPIGTSTYSIGSYGPGLYSLRVDREYFDDLGETLGETLGVIPFTVAGAVEQPLALPAIGTIGLGILVLAIILSATRAFRRASRGRQRCVE